jgi:hypothetical protein
VSACSRAVVDDTRIDTVPTIKANAGDVHVRLHFVSGTQYQPASGKGNGSWNVSDCLCRVAIKETLQGTIPEKSVTRHRENAADAGAGKSSLSAIQNTYWPEC